MGFPEWTLWGMGLAAFGALTVQALALLGLSPSLLKRLRLTGIGLDRRVRALTVYALALLILAMGFFLAGVPIESLANTEEISGQVESPSETPIRSSGETLDGMTEAGNTVVVDASSVTPATPETGAFSGPPRTSEPNAQEPTPSPTNPITSTVSISVTPEIVNTPSPVPSATGTLTPEPTNTATPTATPTETPTPTFTPTPISGETGVLSTDGSTVWLRRSPGGQNLMLLEDETIVLLSDGHANHGGAMWREVTTLEGVTGWILEELLVIPEE